MRCWVSSPFQKADRERWVSKGESEPRGLSVVAVGSGCLELEVNTSNRGTDRQNHHITVDVLDEQQQICLPEGQGGVFGLCREKEERKALEICILNGK